MASPSDVAANAAQGFKVLECEPCAEKIKDALLAAGYRGQWLEIRGGGERGFMVCFSFEEGRTTITQNGRHVAIRVGDLVFDNLHPTGMAFANWLKDFDALGGVALTASLEF